MVKVKKGKKPNKAKGNPASSSATPKRKAGIISITNGARIIPRPLIRFLSKTIKPYAEYISVELEKVNGPKKFLAKVVAFDKNLLFKKNRDDVVVLCKFDLYLIRTNEGYRIKVIDLDKAYFANSEAYHKVKEFQDVVIEDFKMYIVM